MTDKTEGLNQISGHSFIEINTEDAECIGFKDGDRVRVSSRRGSIETTANVSGKTNPGECWMPFHFLDGGANWLTPTRWILSPVHRSTKFVRLR